MKRLVIPFIIAICLSSCQKYYISICQERVTKDYLASVALNTPDPRLKNPPFGEKLIIEWNIAREDVARKPLLHLHVIYKDYTEGFFTYPIRYKMDYVVYSLLNDEYRSKKGILTYEAEVKVAGEEPLIRWKHQLWTNLLVIEEDQEQEQIEEDNFSSTPKTNSSVSDQPRQGSVIETDGLRGEK